MTALPVTLPTHATTMPQVIGESARPAEESSCGPLYFQIGAVGVCVRSQVAGLLESYAKLYRGYRVQTRPARAVEVEVSHRRMLPWFRKHFNIRTPGPRKFKTRDPAAVLPYLEWAINWQIMLNRPEYLQIHASVMQRDGMGFIFPASPGSGKTTLAAGLLARGWRYLSDEFALIAPQTGSLMPYPKALCVKAGSHPVVEELGLPIADAGVHTKPLKGKVRFLDPTRVREGAVGTTCPLRAVIFPKYEAGAQPCLMPMSRAEAAFELNRLSFNFLEFGRGGIDLLAEVIRSAVCYRLRGGEINATCDLVDSVREGLDKR